MVTADCNVSTEQAERYASPVKCWWMPPLGILTIGVIGIEQLKVLLLPALHLPVRSCFFYK